MSAPLRTTASGADRRPWAELLLPLALVAAAYQLGPRRWVGDDLRQTRAALEAARSQSPAAATLALQEREIAQLEEAVAAARAARAVEGGPAPRGELDPQARAALRARLNQLFAERGLELLTERAEQLELAGPLAAVFGGSAQARRARVSVWVLEVRGGYASLLSTLQELGRYQPELWPLGVELRGQRDAEGRSVWRLTIA
jgi:hypothetical protein